MIVFLSDRLLEVGSLPGCPFESSFPRLWVRVQGVPSLVALSCWEATLPCLGMPCLSPWSCAVPAPGACSVWHSNCAAQAPPILLCRLSAGIVHRGLPAGGGHVRADHAQLRPEAGPHAAVDHAGTDLAPGW